MPPTRSNTMASSSNASPSPEPQSSKEVPERSRNAKAQARHREKRKAYISHLEQSVATLKQQLASMGISGAIPAHALNGGSSSSPTSQSETDARLRELLEENERLKAEIQRLRARVESMGGSAAGSGSSRSSTGGHHGLTPPATPSILGALGGNSSGALLPASDEAYDGRRGSALGGPVESFLEGNSAQTASHEQQRPPASALFPSSSSSSSNSQVPLSLHIPQHSQSSAQPHHHPPAGLGISGLAGRPLSAGSHLTQHRYSLPSPLPSAISSSSTPLLPPPSSSTQFNPNFRVQSPFGTPVDPSSGWQIPRGSAPSILTPGFLDYPPRGRELPLPTGFGLAPLAPASGGGNGLGPHNNAHGAGAGGGYDYLMVSAVRGSAPTNGLGSEFPSAVPPLASSSAGNVLPPFYGGNGNADSRGPSSAASSTLPPFSAASSASSYSYYGLPPNHPHQQGSMQQQQPPSGPPSRANSQSRNGTTGSSSSSSPKSLSPGSPIPGGAVHGAGPFAAGSFKMQLEGGAAAEFGGAQGYNFGLGAASATAVGGEQGQQWA